MLSPSEADRTAAVLIDRLGEVAVALAVLRAQEAGRAGRRQAMLGWRRIAAAVAARVDPAAAAAYVDPSALPSVRS